MVGIDDYKAAIALLCMFVYLQCFHLLFGVFMLCSRYVCVLNLMCYFSQHSLTV